ncbi:MAG: S8/S53 family peptidase [Lachnospiraceae bacterium]|nr:S8/S53 family peptidase [Lachnospiraceae bacterium]
MKGTKIINRLICVIAAMTLIIGAFALSAFAEDAAPSLASSSMTIKMGQIASVQVNNLPAGATVSFKSGNKKIVKVSKKGVLTPKKTGKTVVKATVKYSGKTTVLKCTVKVNKAIVAVIDGGAAKGQKVWKAITTSGAGPRGPKHGHAANMIKIIKKEAPKAKILSIKVTDAADKNLDNDAIIKALQVAKQYKASVVYLSFYGPEPMDEEYELVKELIAMGTRVVGPAGNDYGKDARKEAWLTNMKGATSVGAWGKGKRLAKSNKNANVYVKQSSSSGAAARYAGMLANGKTYGVHK